MLLDEGLHTHVGRYDETCRCKGDGCDSDGPVLGARDRCVQPHVICRQYSGQWQFGDSVTHPSSAPPPLTARLRLL